MTFKNTKKIIGVVGLALAMPYIYIIFAWIFIAIATFMNSLFAKAPPKPQIIYGEFPIKVEYEIDGKRKVIEDVVVCEFDGIALGRKIGAGKELKWKQNLKSGNERLTLLKINDLEEIYFPMGNAGYYLGNEENYYMGDGINRKQDVWKLKNNGGCMRISANEALEKYDLIVIDYEISEPINNTFK